jgi:predicted ATPase
MLTSLELKNFRAFRDLKIAPLKRLNLITGKNDTGKTSVLEALRLLLAQPGIGSAGGLVNEFRVGNNIDWDEHFWKWIIYNKQRGAFAELRLSRQGRAPMALILYSRDPYPQEVDQDRLQHQGALGAIRCYSVGPLPPDRPKSQCFSSKPTDPQKDAIDYNRVIQKRGRKNVEALMRLLNPRVQAIEPLQTEQQRGPIIFVDVGLKEMIPVTQMGQGFNRLLNIYSEVIAAEANVLLIDEIENGLHYSVMPQVFEGLFNAVKELDIQIVATTHSWECIVAADDAARKSSPYDLNVIRLDRVGEEVTATVMDDKTLATARDLNWEMR